MLEDDIQQRTSLSYCLITEIARSCRSEKYLLMSSHFNSIIGYMAMV